MKNLLFILTCFFCISSHAASNDSLKIEIGNLKAENAALMHKLSALESKVSSLSEAQKLNSSNIDSVKSITAINADNIKKTADKLGVELKNQEESFASVFSDINKSVSNKSMLFICAIILLLIIVISYILFAQKKNTNTDKNIKFLEDAQKTLESQSIKLDNHLIEILEKKMKQVSESIPANAEPDHSLPLKVADEIVRIQNNIDRMDSNDKNVNRLNKALDRMKTSFTAYGYEIVDMRGQEYTENMPFEARFIPDDTIEEGKRIISGMDKLMVRYNGKMIQAPILAVRQNV